MAVLPAMTIRLDRNLTATKVQLCCNFGCKHHSLEQDEMDCNLRWIEIGSDWKCKQFEHRNPMVATTEDEAYKGSVG